MKKPVIAGVIVAVVVIALGGWYVAAKNNNNTSSTNNMPNMNMSGSSSSKNQTPQATNAVTIQNFAFSPAAITIKAGTTVTWTNKDSVAHTVVETDGQTGPASSDVDPGKSYSFTFKTPGTYHYHCSIHPDMVGTVTVSS